MKTLKEIQQIRETKRKELDLRVNLKANTRRKTYISMSRNRVYIFKITRDNKEL